MCTHVSTSINTDSEQMIIGIYYIAALSAGRVWAVAGQLAQQRSSCAAGSARDGRRRGEDDAHAE